MTPVRVVAPKSQSTPPVADSFQAGTELPLLDNIQLTSAHPPQVLPREVSLNIPASMIGGLAGYTVCLSQGEKLQPVPVRDASVVPQGDQSLLKLTLDSPIESGEQVWLVSDQHQFAASQVAPPRVWSERASRVPDLSQVSALDPAHLNPPDQVVEALRQAKRVLIVSHTPPDGDTVGSGLAMRRLLEKLGKEADYLMDGAMPGWLREQAQPGELSQWEQVSGKDYDLVVMVDVAQLDRVGRARQILERAPQVVVVDHHQAAPPELNCPVHSWITPADAAAVLVGSLAEKLAPGDWGGIAAPLVTGILTDTSLLEKAQRPETAPVLKHLLEKRGDGDLQAACGRMGGSLPAESQGLLMSPVHLKGQLLSPQGDFLRQALAEQSQAYQEENTPQLSLLSVPQETQHLATSGGHLADPGTSQADLQEAMFARLDRLARQHPLAVMLLEHQNYVQVCIRSHDPQLAPQLAESLGGGGKPGIAAAKSSLPLDLLKALIRDWGR